MSTPDPARPVLVASDVHLGSIAAEQQSAFLEWLDQAGDAASWIILNGDLFDFWFEYFWGTTRGHDKALAMLRSVVDRGVRVTFMGGNHDWWGGRYLREEIGLEFLQDPIELDIAGHRTLLAHGDGLGKGDLGYKVLRLVLRGRGTRFAFGSLPPVVGDLIARGVSRTAERWVEPGEAERKRARYLGDWATRTMAEHAELDLVLLGHTHVPEIVSTGENRWYVNSGDWVYHRSYVILREGEEPKLMEWNGSIP